MIYHGAALATSAGLALAGVLAELRSRALRDYHAALLDDPLTPARTRLQRRHLRRRCAECATLAELVVTRFTP